MFKNLFRSKDPDSPRYRLAKAKELHGHAIRYVTERKNDNDAVIGKGGAVSFRDGEVIVFSSADVVFRCRAEELQAWDLLSGDGVVLTGPDAEHGGVLRTVTVHYVYYR